MNKLKILTVASIKGGVGKTISSVNLAGAIAKKNPDMDVILIDLDPQGNASMYLGYDSSNIEQSTSDLFEGYTVLSCVCDTAVENLKIIPCELSLRNIQLRASFNELDVDDSNSILKERMEDLREEITRDTFVILDTHPDFGTLTNNALVCSDRIICPINPCEFSFHGFEILDNNINFIREKMNKKLRILGVFRNNWGKEKTKAVMEINKSLGYFEKYLFETKVRSTIDVENSKMEHLPLVFSSAKSKDVSKDFLKLADEVFNRWEKIIR